ncbi:FAD/NAD(P)-binding oxidoreductase [Sulfitobacter noctilucicola]|uniref:Ferredoxin-NADP reductase n=1 Tax=Sulfitobacter noctilucicola TaxID=1342301 RepID=A0A7W6Q2U4_9RHOB|nr:FAD-binding oxidoreductase [Sulfitobacter noctilucicola]KIN62557.1 FAD/NAD(P)-binding oxidoreductase [Sulfitobacter noctilucicola]MBB4172913.1 ferredoxin-NADP reductase [Sulfitobacter noctilucicola]
MTNTIVLKEISPVTHDTHRYIFSKPQDLPFEAGQAAELAINSDGWREEGRPFTFTSLPEDINLEFVIKSYPDHDGVTEQLPQLRPGSTVTLDGPFGAINDQGPGVFLAAGAGVTPFISILRARARSGNLSGCKLIYSNKTEADIILRAEFEAMQGLETVFTVTKEDSDQVKSEKIDKAFLKEHIDDFGQKFYLCGPGGFVDDVRDALQALGAQKSDIITEEGW